MGFDPHHVSSYNLCDCLPVTHRDLQLCVMTTAHWQMSEQILVSSISPAFPLGWNLPIQPGRGREREREGRQTRRVSSRLSAITYSHHVKCHVVLQEWRTQTAIPAISVLLKSVCSCKQHGWQCADWPQDGLL